MEESHGVPKEHGRQHLWVNKYDNAVTQEKAEKGVTGTNAPRSEALQPYNISSRDLYTDDQHSDIFRYPPQDQCHLGKHPQQTPPVLNPPAVHVQSQESQARSSNTDNDHLNAHGFRSANYDRHHGGNTESSQEWAEEGPVSSHILRKPAFQARQGLCRSQWPSLQQAQSPRSRNRNHQIISYKQGEADPSSQQGQKGGSPHKQIHKR